MARRRNANAVAALASTLHINTDVQPAPAPASGELHANETAVYVKLADLVEHPGNHFSMDEDKIVELARDIERNGLYDYPLAWVNPQGTKEILSGHRRYRAYTWLRDNIDAEKYGRMPVRFRDDIKSESQALQILNNANLYTREVKPSERARSIAVIYDEAEHMRAADPNLAGERSADIAAVTLSGLGDEISGRTVSRMVSVARNLSKPLQDLWDAGVLSNTQVFDLARMPQNAQEKFFEVARNYDEPLKKLEFDAIRSDSVSGEGESVAKAKPVKKKTTVNDDINKQMASHVRALIKQAKEIRKLRERGAAVDTALVSELKEIAESL